MPMAGFKTLCFSMLLLCAQACCAQDEAVFSVKKNLHNDLHDQQLKGRVKSTTVIQWKTASGQLATDKGLKKGDLDRKTKTEYNSLGNIMEQVITLYPDLVTDENPDSKVLYVYDSVDYRMLADTIKKYKYALACVRRYDSKGNKFEERFYDKTGKLHDKRELTCDDLGNIVEERYFMPDSISYFERDIDKYDTQGNNTVKIVFHVAGKLVDTVTTMYNALGLKSELIWKKSFGINEVMDIKYVYDSYDNQGNWTKMTEIDGDLPVFIEEQTIEYY
jgi:hypothetical protein